MTLDPRARVAVVGAGLAGLRTVETLRAEGFAGRIDVVGAEAHPPYSRPPLSKGFLDTSLAPPDCTLRSAPGLDAHWHLGTPVAGLDLAARRLELANGARIPFDGLVVATGARARRWPDGAPPAGAFALRELDDALALRAALEARPRRLLVAGAGFIGGEVAASVASLGIPVTLVELAEQPLGGVLGSEVGALLAQAHRDRGVDVRLRTSIARFVTYRGTLRGAELSDGSFVDAGVCVLALGAEPATDWLAGSGVPVSGGVRCRADLSVPGAELVVAAGDVAVWPHPRFGDAPISVGHWSNAAEQGAHAAHTLLAGHVDSRPFVHVPTFWSEMHDLKLRALGLPALGEPAVLEGDLADRRAVIGYTRDGALVGVLALNMGRRLPAYRDRVGTRAAAGRAPAAA